MEIMLRRLFFVAVLVLAVSFFSMSNDKESFAGGNKSTSSGNGWKSWSNDNGSSDDKSSDDSRSGHKKKKPSKDWQTKGNKNIDDDKHFLGTTDDADLVIKTDNNESVRITSSGNVGVGVPDPQGRLDVGERTDPVGGACPIGYTHVDYNNDGLIESGECWRGSVVKDGKVGINTADPCTELDVNGEISVNCITVINSNGQWVGSPTGLVGPQGPAGPQGEQGIQGPQGNKGDQGIQGIQGEQGEQGLAGTNGTNGTQGATGEKGDKGDPGEDGPTGTSLWTDGDGKVTTDVKVGIGTDSPDTALHIKGHIPPGRSPENHVVVIQNLNSGDNTNGLAIRLTHPNTTGRANNFVTFYNDGPQGLPKNPVTGEPIDLSIINNFIDPSMLPIDPETDLPYESILLLPRDPLTDLIIDPTTNLPINFDALIDFDALIASMPEIKLNRYNTAGRIEGLSVDDYMKLVKEPLKNRYLSGQILLLEIYEIR